MTAVLFAGPSLCGWRDRVPPGLTVLPPAACGDLMRALRGGASRIGLVDGVFGDCRAVWHKEIMVALAEGVPVLGAASMGALRAVECAAFGMQGVGAIFADYAAGRRVADADVALVHGPAETGFLPLTLPLVDADHLVGVLAETGKVTPPEARLLRIAARDLGFRQRTWDSLTAAAGMAPGRARAIVRAAAAAGPGLKTLDALMLARALPHARVPAPRPVMGIDVPHTRHLAAMEREVAAKLASGDARPMAVPPEVAGRDTGVTRAPAKG